MALSATPVSESNKLWVRFQLWLLLGLYPKTSLMALLLLFPAWVLYSLLECGNNGTRTCSLYASNIKLDSGLKALPGTMGQGGHLCF